MLDLVREVRPPFSPAQVVKEFVEVLREYSVNEVSGDRYAGMWPREQFQNEGVEYVPCNKPKSELYGALLPKINSQQVELLEHPKLLAQLVGLERRTSRAGRDSIDHGPSGHDDVCNAVAGVVEVVRSIEPFVFA